MQAGAILGKIILPQAGQRIMRSLQSWTVAVPQRPQKRLSRYQQYRCQAVMAAKHTSRLTACRRPEAGS